MAALESKGLAEDDGAEVPSRGDAGAEVEAEAGVESAEADADGALDRAVGELLAMGIVVPPAPEAAGNALGMTIDARCDPTGTVTAGAATTADADGDPAADVEPDTSTTVPMTAPPVATDIVTAIAASAP